MDTVQIALDADLVAVLNDVGRPPKDSVRELIVLELYREGLISGGKAAELMHVSRIDFIRRADEAGVPYFNMSREELRQEIERAKSI
jgi:predicted HTH domain antitoxin